MCDLTGLWRPVAHAAKNDSAAWQARERVACRAVAGAARQGYSLRGVSSAPTFDRHDRPDLV